MSSARSASPDSVMVGGGRRRDRDRQKESDASEARAQPGTGLLPPYFMGCISYSCHFSDQMPVRSNLREERFIWVYGIEDTVCSRKEGMALRGSFYSSRNIIKDFSHGSGKLEAECSS